MLFLCLTLMRDWKLWWCTFSHDSVPPSIAHCFFNIHFFVYMMKKNYWHILSSDIVTGRTLKFNLPLSSGFIIKIIIIMMAYERENGAEWYSTLPEIQFIMTQYNELHESLTRFSLFTIFPRNFFYAKKKYFFSSQKEWGMYRRNEWVRLLLIECCRGNTSQGGIELSQHNSQNTFPRTLIYLICT